MNFQIIPINMGRILGIPKPMITYPFGFGEGDEVTTVVVFAIKDLKSNKFIIVDTGPPDDKWTMKYHNYQLEYTEEEKPLNALRKYDINPDDVEIVINTHLHWDHCFNNSLFKNAKFYIQKKELEYALNPIDLHKRAYEIIDGVEPPWLSVKNNIIEVDGEYDIKPGIRLIPLPGHTPGSQGVLITDKDSKYLLCGDCIDLYENWEGNEIVKHIASGVHTSLIEYNESFGKIELLEDDGYEVVPSHDSKLFERFIYIKEAIK